MTPISRRTTLLTSLASALVPPALVPYAARAEDENQQIALENPGEYIVADSKGELTGSHDVELPRYDGQRMNYPFTTGDGVQEGWVLIETDVLKDGSTQNVAVAESYPAGIFTSAVMRFSPNFHFTPGLIDGQPRTVKRYRFRMVFAEGDVNRGASTENIGRFKKVINAMRDQKLDKATEAMTALQKVKDAGKFNLTELARYSDLAARLAIFKGNRIEANEHLSTMLWLAGFVDRSEALRAGYEMRLALYAMLGKYDQAVDLYDAFAAKYGREETKLTTTISQLRAAGYGKGVKYSVWRLDEMHDGKKPSPKEGKT